MALALAFPLPLIFSFFEFAELNLHKFFLDYSTGSISKEVSDEISQIKKSQPELFMKETEEELLQEIQMTY